MIGIVWNPSENNSWPHTPICIDDGGGGSHEVGVAAVVMMTKEGEGDAGRKDTNVPWLVTAINNDRCHV